MNAATQPSLQRAWWLRALLVLQAPTAVFAALRNNAEDDVDARSEPLVAIGFLAGVAFVLSTSVAGRLLDDTESGLLVVVAWTVFGGALYGLATVWFGGLLLHVASHRLGGRGSYRRSRHVVGFALAPLALSLVLLWPVRLALYGEDVFRSGGADAGASGTHLLDLLWIAAALWGLALALIGIRAVHAWTWRRAGGALALAAALPALLVGLSLGR